VVGRQELFENGVVRTVPHVIDCAKYGPCTTPSCGYEAGHREYRAAMKEQKQVAKSAAIQKRQELHAAVSGMKVPTSIALDHKLKDALTNSNMSM
jgi:hypothetical protein